MGWGETEGVGNVHQGPLHFLSRDAGELLGLHCGCAVGGPLVPGLLKGVTGGAVVGRDAVERLLPLGVAHWLVA